MKALVGFVAGLGAIGIAMIAAWIFFAFAMTIYGVYLAFSASVVLGIVVLLVEPSPLVIGAVMFVFHKDLAQMIMEFLHK